MPHLLDAKDVQGFAKNVLGFELLPYQIEYIKTILYGAKDHTLIFRSRAVGIPSINKVVQAIIKDNP